MAPLHLYARDPDVGASAVEALHATLAAAYAVAGGYIARGRHGVGYYHEGGLVVAVRILSPIRGQPAR